MVIIMDKENQIYELRKQISILEWDIPLIKNKDLKILKEKQLSQCKSMLEILKDKYQQKVEVV